MVTMDVCRICLSPESDMIQFNESFVAEYNILTGLHVKMYDELPQYTCQSCSKNVKNFTEFREKSISSETALRKIFTGLKSENIISNQDNKPLQIIDNISMVPKEEIKHETYDDDVHDDCYDNKLEDTIIDCKDVILDIKKIEDIKPIQPSKKINTKRKKKINLNNNPLMLWEEKKDINEENSKNLLCGLCKTTLDNINDLNEHLEKHIKDRQCAICKMETRTWAQLLSHRLIHLPAKQKRCHLCYKRFVAGHNLEYHYKKIHFGEDSKVICNICFSSYDSPGKLQKHIWALHSGRMFICDYCSKCFSARTNLRSHIVSHMKQKSYVCDLCGVSFNYLNGLKDHTIRKHVPSKVYCKTCKRPFLSKGDHDRHKCSIISKVLCPTCGKYCIASQIKRHLLSHTNIAKFKCNRCPAAYKSKTGLKVHLDKHDGNKTQQCEYCPAKFYNASTLIKHRRIHTGEKPYVCKVCSKGFTGNYNLKVHMKVHGEYLVNKKDKIQDNLQPC